MPHIQVLPKVASFGSRLAEALGGAVGDIGAAHFNKKGDEKRNAADQKVIEGITGNENPSDMDYISAFSKLSKEGKKSYEPIWKSLFDRGTKKIEAEGKVQAKQAEVLQKQAIEDQKHQQEVAGLSAALDELDALLPYTGSTLVPGKSFGGGGPGQIGWNREAVEAREKFDKTGFWATDKVYTNFNKGTVSNIKFESIKEDLAPRSDLSERKNKARIDALRTIMSLPRDVSKEKFEKVVDQEIKKVKAGESIREANGKALIISPSGQEVEIPYDQVDAALAAGGRRP